MRDFNLLQLINELIEGGREVEARQQLIQHLNERSTDGDPYSELLNHLLRRVGLYPYLRRDQSGWQDRLVLEAFSADVGVKSPMVLHREQSALLARLLRGENIAVSAPTSFGKSFVIDAFIAIRRPRRVLIIVPTIALMDEARRRLQQKFGRDYGIVTTSDVDNIPEKVIFIFPQERAITYVSRIDWLDIFIVDEFYKASVDFDKQRSPVLVRAIIQFSRVSGQRYFLAPNISRLKDSPFTKGMDFLKLDFNTVFLKKIDLSKELGGKEADKVQALERLACPGVNTLVYAGSHAQVGIVVAALKKQRAAVGDSLLRSFSSWLGRNYSTSWLLASAVSNGVGVHTGQVHRAISQIQIRMFDDINVSLDAVVSTSSIIEGVNTAAQRVVVWSNKNGSSKLSDFDFKNLLGRGGRMFKHFVGEIYILEKPPADNGNLQLSLEIPDALLGVDAFDEDELTLSDVQQLKVSEFESRIGSVLDISVLRSLQSEGKIQSSDSSLIWKIVKDVAEKPLEWKALANLNSNNVDSWEWVLYKVINLDNSGWDAPFGRVVAFIKESSRSWTSTIPNALHRLSGHGVSVEDYFKLERTVTFKMSSLLGDINSIHARVFPGRGFDISSFVHRMAHAFLPSVVYQLEEYGLPRMLSRKIQDSKVMNFEGKDLTLTGAIEMLKERRGVVSDLFDGEFEKYILDHFYEGVIVAGEAK